MRVVQSDFKLMDDQTNAAIHQDNIYTQPDQINDNGLISGGIGKDGDNEINDVKKVVSMLKVMGYYHQGNSGIWGSQAQQAMENFQRDLYQAKLISKKDIGKKINSKSVSYKQMQTFSIPKRSNNENKLSPFNDGSDFLPNVYLNLNEADLAHSNIPLYTVAGNTTNQKILPTRGNYWRINKNSVTIKNFEGEVLKDKKIANHTRCQIYQDKYIKGSLHVYIKSESGEAFWTDFSNLSLDSFVSTLYFKTQVSGQSHTASCVANGSETSGSGCKGVSEEMFDNYVKDYRDLDYEVGTTSKESSKNLNNEFLSLMRETYNPDVENANSPEKLVHLENVRNNNLKINPNAWTHYDSNIGFDYLDSHLKQGIPMVVGLNHTFQYRGSKGINEGTTDHFVLITGLGTYQRKKYYTFLDPGTSKRKWGASQKNVMFEERSGVFKAYKVGGSGAKNYTLSMVVLLEKDTEKYKYHRQWNQDHRKEKMNYKPTAY